MRTFLSGLAVALVLGVTLTVSGNGHFVAPTPAVAATIVSGDIDCDSSVALTDVQAGMRALAGLPGGSCLATAGDVNCNGTPGLEDMQLLRRHFAGLPVELPGGCPAIGEAKDAGPTSTERIQAAFAAGKITKGEALLYHVYSDLGDDALPSEYRGPAGDDHETTIFHEIAIAWPTLSPSERAALQPYIVPPAAEGSWTQEPGFQAQAVQWETVSNANIKVWWQTKRPEDAAKAAGVLAEMETKIWPELLDYMGHDHAPLSDAGYPNSGGDGKYDIYLVHNAPGDDGKKPVLGWVSPLEDATGRIRCDETPTYMVLNSRVPLTPAFYSTVAHEFMHSVQFTYAVGDCLDYRWLMESTSTWVESWLYPKVNGEHGFGAKYLDQLQTSLAEWGYKEPRQYGSYLFWYYLQHIENMEYAVRDTWDSSEHANSLMAVQTAISGVGGIKEQWAKSALYNWNREPFDEFTELDQIWAMATWKDMAVEVADQPISYPVPTALGYMQQDHYHFEVVAGVGTLTFLNPFAGSGEEYAKVQALLKINGAWEAQPRDWTEIARPSFCLDKPEEDVEELVIIITNSNYIDRSHKFEVGDGTLVASPLGCKGWTGSASAEVTYFDATFTITVDNMRFDRSESDRPGDRYDFYDLVETGTATWHVSGMWPGGCPPSGTMTLDQPGGTNSITGDITIDRELLTYYVHVGGSVRDSTFDVICEDSTWQMVWPVIPVTWNGGLTKTPMKDEGGTFVLDAEYTDPSPAYGGTWRWRFTELE